jgi:sugar phosphate isomerase/epimerase
MRLGAPIMRNCPDPDSWAAAHVELGYSAAYCPIGPDAADDVVRAYAKAAAAANIVIAETGAWSNPLSEDAATAAAARQKCIAMLALAERIGARCCVNIAGSCGRQWDGHDERNLMEQTFDRIVEVARSIIDAVRPTRTFFTLEPMPWMYPDSADSYLRLLRAIDRPAFGVHADPVNMVVSPRLYYENGAMIRDFFGRLGPHIRSCHAKDIVLDQKLTVHLSECCPGHGRLDYAAYLGELARLDADTPLMLEHMTTADDYVEGAAFIRRKADEAGLSFVTPSAAG